MPAVSAGPALTHVQRRILIQNLEKSRTDKALFAKLFFGVDLFPWQRAAMAVTGRVETWVAGRRTGKTLACTIDRVHDLVTKGPNRIGFIGGPSVDQAAQYFREIEAAVNRPTLMSALIEGGPTKGLRWAPFPQVKFVNGSIMHGRSTVRDGVYLRGKGAHFVALTEAAWIPDAVYHQVVRALVLDRHGDIRLESTPNGMNYVHELDASAEVPVNRWVRTDGPGGVYRSVRATVFDNPTLDRADIDAIRRETPDHVWRAEYLAEYVDDSEAVFPWSLLAQLFDYDYEPLDRRYDATKKYVIGVDLAQVHDYTAICVLDVTGQPPYRLAHWRRFRGTPYMGPGGVVEQVNELRQAFSNARVYVDATSERAVAESIPGADPVIFTGNERTEMLSSLIVRAEQHDLQLPASWTQLRDEMRAMRRTRTSSGRVRMDHPRDGYDDCIWSLALAVRGLAKAGTSRTPEAVAAFRRSTFWTP